MRWKARQLSSATQWAKIFEVFTTAAAGVKERIEKLAGILAVSYFGSHLHVFCGRRSYTETGLLKLLRDAGLDVQTVGAIPVTLEDAFVRLVQKGN